MQNFRKTLGQAILAWSVLIALLVGLSTVGPADEAPATLNQDLPEKLTAVLKRIEAATAGVTALSAEFLQTKKLAAFDRDLEMAGHLFMQRPDRFAWQVDRPIQYRMVIKDKTLFQWDNASDIVQKLSLADNPQFTALSGQMEKWFSGRYNTLLSDYQVSLLNEAPIRLQFRPRKQSLAAEFVKYISVTFEEDARYIREFDLLEVNQDRTTIRFSHTRINPALDDSVWEVREGTPINIEKNAD